MVQHTKRSMFIGHAEEMGVIFDIPLYRNCILWSAVTGQECSSENIALIFWCCYHRSIDTTHIHIITRTISPRYNCEDQRAKVISASFTCDNRSMSIIEYDQKYKCRSSSSSSSSSIRQSFTSEDLVSAPNLELGCAMILHNCASDYIQTVLVV